MKTSTFRALFAVGALAAVVAASGCVADRPSRNGVFNENQYVRKDFLTTDGTHPDPGWFLKATVTQVSTPNPLSGLGVFPGADTGFGSGLGYIQFAITSDKLQMVNMRDIQANPGADETAEVVNAWPATNVDLKYQVNLDGEKTNFYQENQELDWQQRQWVKVNFDKNDMSDVAPLGYGVTEGLEKCGDMGNSSATLVPNSFQVVTGSDWTQDYIQWAVQITIPLNFTDAACTEAFGTANPYNGASSESFGRQNSTFVLMYSLMRVKDLDNPATMPNAYVPLVVDEKDPIRHKYGAFEFIAMDRDPTTQLLAGTQMTARWNPLKPQTYYFTSNVPYWIIDDFIGHRSYDSDSDQALDTAQTCLTPGCTRASDGVQQQTNQLLKQAGVPDSGLRFTFLNWNDATNFGDGLGPSRQYGDVRYSFVQYVGDIDADTGWTGYGPSAADPRTGELLNATVNLSNAPFSEFAYQLDYYLQELGASQGLDYSNANGVPQEWPTVPTGQPAKCVVGTSLPLVTSVVQEQQVGNSSLFKYMQQYLGYPQNTYGNLGPDNFIVAQDQDFFNAYYALIPYSIYADPDANPFVIREGGAGIYGPTNYWDMMEQEAAFHAQAAQIDLGQDPVQGGITTGPAGVQAATDFINTWRQMTQNHADLQYAKLWTTRSQVYDAVSPFGFNQIMSHASRHCVANTVQPNPGSIATHWETKQEWSDHTWQGYYNMTSFHEFGHTLALAHNFMGSIDQNNFPIKTDPSGNPILDADGNNQYAIYTNSVMEYDVDAADFFADAQWGPYDKGAIAWIYSNNAPKPVAPGISITGQINSTTPWNDPLGFQADGATEIQFMSCHDNDIAYTPLCRQHDSGTTPSAIVASQIDTYDWHWAFTNFRVYRKYWDNSLYADHPPALFGDLRRFLMMWEYDWSSGTIVDTLRRIGFNPPPGVPALNYYQQLENKFNYELSNAMQLVGAFHEGIIVQSVGERPVATVYDAFYGDVTQQGIILDKLDAMEYWVGLWPNTNFNPSDAGAYFTSYSDAPDPTYQNVAQNAADFMIGGQYDAFPYFAPLAVSLFAQDTHNPAFSGQISDRNWIGGHTFGGPPAYENGVTAFLAYFRDLATQNNYKDAANGVDCTHGYDSCTYDPRNMIDNPSALQEYNEFIGPDQRYWAWAYILDRDEYIAVQRYVNTASYLAVRAYNNDIVYNLDDGDTPGAAYSLELPLKFTLDAFNQYN
jgi:hypothetical protein